MLGVSTILASNVGAFGDDTPLTVFFCVSVPVLRVVEPLQDVLVRRGQQAHFIIQLSASATGSWFWNGTKVEDNGQFSTQQSGTCHSLLIQGVELCDDRTEVTFVATGIRESAFLLLQGMLSHNVVPKLFVFTSVIFYPFLKPLLQVTIANTVQNISNLEKTEY